MGGVLVHEFMSLDGVIDAPTWTAEFGFDPKMGQAIAAVVQRSRGILLGRTTFGMFAHVLRKGLRQGHRTAAARATAEPPDLQHRLRYGAD